ncbi:MAG TPA: M48 family metalloprotease [Pyrinomonadaceae bacterium]|jgi:Zn-dependent protease with chaperone function|nr:M48 family metalloprotease [Pyrinomonadaceae bacterium]
MKNLYHGRRASRRLVATLMTFAVLAIPASALAQCQQVTAAPKNRYSIQEDVQAGQQAAQEAERQLPIMNDREIENYINRIGQRLVSSIPSQFQHREFRYSFRVVNARDINAFSLPGGPSYVNRGMIEAARNEGEMAGVMAHEISHAALRHATAQATETQKYQIGSVLGQIAGAVIGGPAGAVIGAGSQIGFGAGALKYSRKYETQADVLGAEIMARAGYDPRDLANMFRTIERQGGGSGGPEWMSSHPNPGNRYACIEQMARVFRVTPGEGYQNSRDFQNVQARLRGGGRAPSMEEIARGGRQNPNGNNYPQQNDTYARGSRVAYPSASYQQAGNNLFRASIPSNWRQLGGDQTSVTYAPEGAYGSQGITHGVMFGTDREQYNDLQRASQQYVNDLLQAAGNNYLRQSGGFRRTTVANRQALYTTLSGRSPITGRNEVVTILTTMLRSGDIFYMAAVSPQDESNAYQRTFSEIMRTLQLNDQY